MASPWPRSTCSLLGRQPTCITSQLLATKMSVNQEKKSIVIYQQPFIQEVLLVRYWCCPLPHLPCKCLRCFLPCPPSLAVPMCLALTMPRFGSAANGSGCRKSFSPARARCLLFRSGTPPCCSCQELHCGTGRRATCVSCHLAAQQEEQP